MVGLHESVGGEVDDLVLFPLIGGYGWLVPGTVIGVVGASVLWRAAASLPSSTRMTVAIAIGLFGCGAVGLEVVEAVVTGESADVGTTFFLVTGAQELLEMLGATLFLYAMLVELQRRSAVVDLRDAVGSGSLDPSEDRARPEPVTRDLFSPHR
jgi:hypothetical protein